MKNLYELVKSKGIRVESHESDMYIPVTIETREIVNKYEFKSNVTVFKNQIDGEQWFDCPFAFAPYWEAKAKLVK